MCERRSIQFCSIHSPIGHDIVHQRAKPLVMAPLEQLLIVLRRLVAVLLIRAGKRLAASVRRAAPELERVPRLRRRKDRGPGLAPASSSRVPCWARACSHNRTIHAPTLHHLWGYCPPRPASVLPQRARKSTAHAPVVMPPVRLDNSAPRSGCTFPSRKPVVPNPWSSSDRAAAPRLPVPARNCKHR